MHIIGKNLYNTFDSKEKMTLEDKLNYYLDGRIGTFIFRENERRR